MTNGDAPVAFVTGAGSGLGEATARRLACAGYSVACLDIDQDAAARVSRELVDYDVETVALACDVSDERAVFECADALLENFGRVDAVVNNAAVDHTLSVEDLTVEQWDQVIGVNLRGPFLLAKAVLPAMREQGHGHFINISSTAGTRAWANASAYHASKWGLIGFSRALGVEGRECGVRSTTIIPGGMRTHFFDRFEEQGIPMPDQNKLQDPGNVADLIVHILRLPPESVVQEVIVTPFEETSWP
jgi:NAD(P)-dependent dehydrogenase (short-subunit alcohol dehydrogenase family)